jgi:S-formylglutathione hydrolase FrmB
MATDRIRGRVALLRVLDVADLLGLGQSAPNIEPGTVVRGELATSHLPRGQAEFVVAYPPGIDPARPIDAAGRVLPVVVSLHGNGGNAASLISGGYHRFLAATVKAGTPPFVMVGVDGGSGYWHRHRDGQDAAALITEQLLPELARRGLTSVDDGRLGFHGISMGGYGALLLAEQLGAGRVRAVAVAAPAIFADYAASAPGAFDDATDFTAHDVVAGRAALNNIAVRLSVGYGDPFYWTVTDFADQLAAGRSAAHQPAVQTYFGWGGHDERFFSRMAPADLTFLGHALTP